MRWRAILMSFALALAATACGGDGDAVTTNSSGTSPTSNPVRTSLWFLSGEKLVRVERPAPAEPTPQDAIQSLLTGPTAVERAQGITTVVPNGVTVRSVNVNDGTATVDLTTIFGSGGGSFSMMARMAQLVYTATEIPGVERVVLLMDGSKVDTLGGEGLDISAPQTRAMYSTFLA